MGAPGLTALLGREVLIRDPDQHRLVHGLAAVGLLEALRVDREDRADRKVAHVDPATRDVDDVGPRAPVRVEERSLGERSEASQYREERDDAEDAQPAPDESAEHLATLDHAAAPLDDGAGEGVALGIGVGERVAFLDEGTSRHEVLAPRDETDAEEEQSPAHGRAEGPGLRVDPVAGAEPGNEQHAEQQGDRDDALDQIGIAGGGLQVRVVGAQSLQRDGRCVVVLIAHWRSPTQ